MFTVGDLSVVAEAAAEAWRRGEGGDWAAPAGTLAWSCHETARHAIDTTLAPAFFLASRKVDGYPDYGAAMTGEDAPPQTLAEALVTAARVLAAVVAAAEPCARAAIWRRPRVEVRGPEDFAPRGALELVLHAHDVCAGLGVAFAPPPGPCDRLRRHTEAWPHWRSPGWAPLGLAGNPWADLLRSSGRLPPAPGRSM